MSMLKLNAFIKCIDILYCIKLNVKMLRELNSTKVIKIAHVFYKENDKRRFFFELTTYGCQKLKSLSN